ncbi:MAG: hypothetical protein II249_05205 [Bacteroidaceae bacterium]|nr:hypothetical protein [Bacteroidaceae bacterium]
MSTKTKKKSPACIEKDRKRKAVLKRKQTIKTVAMVVIAVALILLMVVSLTASPRQVW